MFKVLHKDLLTDLDVAKGKGSVARLQQVAMAHLLKADPNYLPIDLPNLEPEVFLGFLLLITDSKAKKYHKSYGVHHSALMFLFKFLWGVHICKVSNEAEAIYDWIEEHCCCSSWWKGQQCHVRGSSQMTVEYSWCAWPHFTQKGSSVVVVSWRTKRWVTLLVWTSHFTPMQWLWVWLHENICLQLWGTEHAI